MKSRVFDRRFPGIGRVRRASGTSDAATHRAVGAMLTMLVKKGRLDLVRSWADGLIHAMDLYDRYRTEKLDLLPSAESMRPLWTVGARLGAADAHLAKITNHHTATSVRYTWAALKALKEGATLADVPALVQAFRVQCEKQGTPRMFTNGRNNVRAFLRATVGTSHPLYLAVKDIQPLPLGHTPGRPFTRDTLATFLTAMREQHGEQIAGVARSLALSGMRPEEYWGEWQGSEGVVTIRTAKQRTGAPPKYRTVFTVVPLVRAGRGASRQTFEKKMRLVTVGAHELYDLRRTFMHLMEQARIPRSRRMYYLGHQAGDVSGLYEEHEVTEYLTVDRAELLAYLGDALHA